MKKNISLFLLLTTILATTVSCDNAIDSTDESFSGVQETSDTELLKLYNSIDSLQSVYSAISVSRGATLNKWGRRFLSGTVDACVSALTAGTGPVGAFVCGTIASGLYDDYFDYCARRMTRSPRRVVGNISYLPNSIIFTVDNADFVDSIGYYHNLVLDEIRSKGSSFVDDNGNIDYNSFYNEVIIASQKSGIVTDCSFDKQKVFNYINSVIKPLAQLEDCNKESCLSIIFNESYYDINNDSSKLPELRNICDKIIYNDLCIDDNVLVEYGKGVNSLIENSAVSSSTKSNLKIANNIAINSSLYWSSK